MGPLGPPPKGSILGSFLTPFWDPYFGVGRLPEGKITQGGPKRGSQKGSKNGHFGVLGGLPRGVQKGQIGFKPMELAPGDPKRVKSDPSQGPPPRDPPIQMLGKQHIWGPPDPQNGHFGPPGPHFPTSSHCFLTPPDVTFHHFGVLAILAILVFLPFLVFLVKLTILVILVFWWFW